MLKEFIQKSRLIDKNLGEFMKNLEKFSQKMKAYFQISIKSRNDYQKLGRVHSNIRQVYSKIVRVHSKDERVHSKTGEVPFNIG